MKKSPLSLLAARGRLFAACLAAFASLSCFGAEWQPLLNYQGRVQVGATDFKGNGLFKFALVNGGGDITFWSNDGSTGGGQEPAVAVELGIVNGLYNAMLGDTSIPRMAPLPAGVFETTGLWLRVWFSDGQNGFQQFSPDQPLTPVPYAYHAASADVLTRPITEAQLPGSVARLNREQVFAFPLGIGVDKPEDQLGVGGGAVIDQNNSNSGTIAHGLRFGALSGEGIGSKRDTGGEGHPFGLDFYTSFIPRLTIANNGNVGIGTGTNQPRTLLDLRAVDPIIELRNVNDEGAGAFLENTFSALQLGMFVELDAHEQVPRRGRQAFFGLNTAGEVGSLTNSLSGPSAPGFRNLLDDGRGNAAIQGNAVMGGNLEIRDTNGTAVVALRSNGTASVKVLEITGGADVAEPFHLERADIPKGALVVIDEDHPGQLKMSDQACDTRVAGVVSGANGVHPGLTLRQEGKIEGGQNVALSGRVYALADARSNSIKPGDLLTTSATPGHAMKATDHARARGAIVGKAMTGLKEGQGLVLVLVTLQ